MINILFRDYSETKVVYHVVTIADLDNTLKYGIRFDDKNTYKNKYYAFHSFIDNKKPKYIPQWVKRSNAVFASLNFQDTHIWHSHSALLSIKIDENLCWICNENIANFLYEPLMLQKISKFESAQKFIAENGSRIVEDYWSSSLSFKENLKLRKDKMAGYDAEILVLHDILPKDIELLYIASDHRFMEVNEWKEFFRENKMDYANC